MRSTLIETVKLSTAMLFDSFPSERSHSMYTDARLVHSTTVSMPRNRSAFLQSGAIAIWVILVGVASFVMLNYDFTPGPASSAPSYWPESSTLSRQPGRSTILMFAHPRCPCTATSIDELRQILGKSTSPIDCQIIFLMPPNASQDWLASANVRAARAIKNVRVVNDGGEEARRFTVATSGHVLLFDESGRLAFSGGITGSRGHAGPNNGATTLLQSIKHQQAADHELPTFGCPLFHDNADCRESAKCPS